MGLVRTDTSVSRSRQQPRSRVRTNTSFLRNGQFLHIISCRRVTAVVYGASETMSTHFHAPNQLIRASAYVRICEGSQHSRNLQCDLICTLYLQYTDLLFLRVHGFWCPEGIVPQQSSKCKGSCINLSACLSLWRYDVYYTRIFVYHNAQKWGRQKNHKQRRKELSTTGWCKKVANVAETTTLQI